jgi:hypothetical protein
MHHFSNNVRFKIFRAVKIRIMSLWVMAMRSLNFKFGSRQWILQIFTNCIFLRHSISLFLRVLKK